MYSTGTVSAHAHTASAGSGSGAVLSSVDMAFVIQTGGYDDGSGHTFSLTTSSPFNDPPYLNMLVYKRNNNSGVTYQFGTEQSYS